MNIPLMVEVPDIALRAANVNLGSIKHKELERANRLALAYERLRDDIAEYVRRKMRT
jgi:hypothetical protein